MENAHLRMGTLQFTKVTRDTTIDVRVHVDRAIAEHEPDNRSARCHLLSVFGNDQEIAAIAAALSEEARFYLTGPQIERLMVSVGAEAVVFRSSLSVPGRRRPIRHLVALSTNSRRPVREGIRVRGGQSSAMAIPNLSSTGSVPASAFQSCPSGASGSLTNSEGNRPSSV